MLFLNFVVLSRSKHFSGRLITLNLSSIIEVNLLFALTLIRLKNLLYVFTGLGLPETDFTCAVKDGSNEDCKKGGAVMQPFHPSFHLEGFHFSTTVKDQC